MKKTLIKLVAIFGMIILFTTFFSVSANTAKRLNLPDNVTAIEGEDYYCFEAFTSCLEYLDPKEYEEIYTDDIEWDFVLEPAPNWWYNSNYYYSADGPVNDNFSLISPYAIYYYKQPDENGFNQTVYNNMINYASSCAFDFENNRLAITLRGPYKDNQGQAKIIFIAPKDGNIVVHSECDIIAATNDSNFNAFGGDNKCGYVEICVWKNSKIVSNTVKISAENLISSFPKAGENGYIKVKKGDEIVIHMKSFGNIKNNNTFFIDPVVTYVDVEENVVNKSLNNQNNNWWLWSGISALIIVSIFVFLTIFKNKKVKLSN